MHDHEDIEISNPKSFGNEEDFSIPASCPEVKEEELSLERFLLHTSPWVERLCACTIGPENSKELFIMSVHAMLLDAGFICVAERESANKVLRFKIIYFN